MGLSDSNSGQTNNRRSSTVAPVEAHDRLSSTVGGQRGIAVHHIEKHRWVTLVHSTIATFAVAAACCCCFTKAFLSMQVLFLSDTLTSVLSYSSSYNNPMFFLDTQFELSCKAHELPQCFISTSALHLQAPSRMLSSKPFLDATFFSITLL